MAGFRQHHIPRFLQKGFASKTRKKEVYTFVFTASEDPYETNLVNVGLEKNFYGTRNDQTADEAITRDELRHVSFVEELRNINKNTIVDSKKSSSLLGHMLIRAKYLRDSINQMGSVFCETLQSNLGSDKDPQQLIKAFVQANRDMVAERMKKRLPKHLNDSQKGLKIKYALDNQDKWPSEFKQKYQEFFLKPLGTFHERIPEIVKNSHNEVLKKEVVSNVFLDVTQSYVWKLFYFKDQNLILGDVGPVGKFGPDNTYKPLIFYKKNLQQAFLPISNNHLLVGSSQEIECSVPSPTHINELTASLSRQFFISSVNTKTETKFASIIGSNSSAVKDEDIFRLENKIQSNWFGNKI